MKEFDFEVKEKKKLANMNRYNARKARKKYGSCVMPSDFLTPAQRKKLNGEIKVYEVGKPISWAEFKSYPAEMKQEWVNRFVERFNCSTKGMAMVFGIQASSINNYCRNNGIKISCDSAYTAQKGEMIRAWIDGASESESEESVEDVVVSTPELKVEKKQPEIPYFVQTLRSGSMDLRGTSSEIFQTLFGIFRDANLQVTLNFSVIPEEKEAPESVVVPEPVVEPPEKEPELLDLNSATFDELRKIGFSTNQALNVINARPIVKLEDLGRVPGVNKCLYQLMEKRVMVTQNVGLSNC